ncbi:MAG: D-alanyl-D-alanine carboxypeptidase/D-alanyl-D-alanine-endopeptidase [Candidatus Nanopelagicales bacterium]|nr:D-alanyl-D-alanine carboxypeptidase/D-alanyl-D-alanine-endopeptidase [Candidatus Nanopelagicales bacterium]
MSAGPRTHVWRLALPVAVVLAMGAGLVPTSAYADATAGSTVAEAQVNNRISKRLHNGAIGPDLALVVMDAQSQRIVASRDADRPMLPASNMKLVTAVNVLSTMGAPARFTTTVFAGSTPGSIVLKGGGDPLLTKASLRALAQATAAAVDPAAPVIVDTDVSLFPRESNGPGWTRGYVPSVVSPVSALALLGDYSTRPAQHAADAFVAALRTAGIQASRGRPVTVADGQAALASIDPHTVADAVHLMLLDSENNVAEILFRHVALAAGAPPTWQGASAAATANLAALGISTTGIRVADGSGVSRSDSLTALTLASLLRLASVGDPARYAAIFDPGSLPTAGVDGTLRARLHRFTSGPSACARGAIRAKTGTLHDTIALSGTAQDASGQLKVFAFLVNDRPTRVSPLRTRQAIDGLASTITGCW